MQPTTSHRSAETSSRAAIQRARRRRWWLGFALAVGLLALGVLLSRARSEGGPQGSPQLGAPSMLVRVQRLLGLGATAGATRGSPAPGELGASSGEMPGEPDGAKGSAAFAAMAAMASDSDTDAPAGARLAPGAELGATLAGAPAFDDGVARDARVVGRVLDATGGPIAGAKLAVHFAELARARNQKAGRVMGAPAPDAQWLSDAEGRFEGLAPSGRLWIVASAEAYSEGRAFAQAPADNVVIVLAPGARVSGRVQRGDGSPVSGASLQIKSRGMNLVPLKGASDERGEFSIGGVPAGVVEVTASALGLSSARQWLRLTLAEDSSPIVLTLGKAHSVYGSVRAPDGSPCAAGVVRARRQLSGMANIGEQGQYRFDGLDDGTHELSVVCMGVGTQEKSVTFGPDSPQNLELNWQLDAGFAIAGSVRLENGDPLVGAMVWPYSVAAPAGANESSGADLFAGSTGVSCITDEHGQFECGGLRAGWYQVSAGSASGTNATSDPVRVDAESRPELALIVPASGEVRVHVVAGTAGSIARNGSPNGFPARGVFARGAGRLPISAVQRGDGFVFEHLQLGRYRIAIGAGAAEPGPSAVDVALTEPGQIIEVELRAPEVMAIGGAVVDSGGEPVPDAWVQASLVEPQSPLAIPFADPVLTSSDGRFEIGDLLPGRYTLSAVHTDGEAQQRDVVAGQRDVRLVVSGYGSLAGSVTGADGQPARRFSVLILRDSSAQPLSVDGERGRWAMPWVAPGEYRILVTSASGGAFSNALVVSGKETKLAVRLDPELVGAALSGLLARKQ